MDKTLQDLYEEKEKRINEAIELKVPDRIPVVPLFGFFPARCGGITFQEAMYDSDKMMGAWLKTMMEFQPDAYENPFTSRFLGSLLEILDYKQLKWPGHGVASHYTYQFIEKEYMKAEEYDAFLFDPSDYIVRTYWPRIFGALESFKMLPPLNEVISYYMGFGNFSILDMPEIANAMKVLLKVGAEVQRMLQGARTYAGEMKRLGIPPQFGALTQAPFDTLADFFRGTIGTMLDIHRNPDKLLEATEKLLPIMLQLGIRGAKRTGISRVFIPLHKGDEHFISSDQFKTFYWPNLRKLMIGLIDNGLVPCPFFEGNYTSRLEIIADIPKGKACYAFENTDIFKAKEVLGKHVCIRGNVPLSILCTRTPSQVIEYCRKLIDIVGKGGGFIMDASTVLDDAKPENVKAMVDFTKEYGVYR